VAEWLTAWRPVPGREASLRRSLLATERAAQARGLLPAPALRCVAADGTILELLAWLDAGVDDSGLRSAARAARLDGEPTPLVTLSEASRIHPHLLDLDGRGTVVVSAWRPRAGADLPAALDVLAGAMDRAPGGTGPRRRLVGAAGVLVELTCTGHGGLVSALANAAVRAAWNGVQDAGDPIALAQMPEAHQLHARFERALPHRPANVMLHP
jgi:hypothetical protein